MPSPAPVVSALQPTLAPAPMVPAPEPAPAPASVVPAPAPSPAPPHVVPAPAPAPKPTGPVVPAVFIFGDSTVDVGTNNYLNKSGAKADMPYNGIDYPGSVSTGRFSNGYNTADCLVMYMGYPESPPAFLHILNQHGTYLRSIQNFSGVNFASGGSGLLHDTGNHLYTEVIPMRDQVQQFKTVHSNLSEAMGGSPDNIISKSFFLISVGSNDIFEYFALNKTQTLEEFIATLIDNYRTHLKSLLDLGARKFGIISVPAIGCCPHQRTFNESGGCREALNPFALVFFEELQVLLLNLTSEYPAMAYSLGDTYKMTNALLHISDPQHQLQLLEAYGLKEIEEACCGNGTLYAESPCRSNSRLCKNRQSYFFWDQYHPTEAASRVLAYILYEGTRDFVVPMNFGQLAEQDQ
ncbi:hypothetical protein F2P56_023559 [Juglans regia]|uniref:GDSL esterase/lipase At5g55050-like n=2 Tax=Juglans regia TaxID=51240 RepID=A0A833T6R0_JUGRE|nr:GDSL esterase/lipase At5g55050-like [Juglans regia]KAF5453841.1 hypothetical protein F2P56_023559 [Juglans regia]